MLRDATMVIQKLIVKIRKPEEKKDMRGYYAKINTC